MQVDLHFKLNRNYELISFISCYFIMIGILNVHLEASTMSGTHIFLEMH